MSKRKHKKKSDSIVRYLFRIPAALECIWSMCFRICMESREHLMCLEDKAFSPSYDSAPSPFPSLASPSPVPVSKFVRRHTGRLTKRDNLLTGEGGGGREGAKSYDGETWSFMIHYDGASKVCVNPLPDGPVTMQIQNVALVKKPK